MGYKFPLEATIQSRWPPYLYEAQPYQNLCSSASFTLQTEVHLKQKYNQKKPNLKKNQSVLCGLKHLDVLAAHLKTRKGG